MAFAKANRAIKSLADGITSTRQTPLWRVDNGECNNDGLLIRSLRMVTNHLRRNIIRKLNDI